ncbi:MAG: hypothetical protein J5482_00480 [Oscillospiraceae bacterium]|nr:hypothetical protein [Oscillospiraceae bacterium]
MKTWKMVSGILSMVLFVVITLQSCAAGVAEAFSQEDANSGTGVLVAFLLLAAGIVSVVTRQGKKGGNIALIVLFALAAVLGFSATVFKDLQVYAVWCLVCLAIACVDLARRKPPKADTEKNSPAEPETEA